MSIAAAIITLLYYGLVACVTVALIWNFVKEKNLEREVLYVIVLVPFLLRLFRLK